MKIHINGIIRLFIILITISYTGAFAGYQGCMTLVCCFIALFAFGLLTRTIHINSIKACSPLWAILLAYLCLNSLLNMPSSFLYIILFGGGLLVMLRGVTAKEIESIIKLLKNIAIILAISILWQAYLPTTFYFFASKWFSHSNQYDMLRNLGIVSHQYSGLFYEVSFSAFILSIGCMICFAESSLNKQGRVINAIFFAVQYYSVILTGKRSLMLIVPVLVLVFWIFNNIEKISAMKLFALIGFVFILIWQSNNIFGLVENILTKGQGHTIQLSSRERFWQLALNMFKENPLLGKGINSFDIAFNKSGIRSTVYDFAGAHNAYIQLLAETGVVGTLLYVSAIFSTIASGIKEALLCYRNNKKNKMMYNSIAVLALLIIMMYGISGNVLHQPQQVFMLFLFLGIIVNLKKIDDSDFNIKKVKNIK